jgi:glycosyltransferase involved in cell wall biosynthesis
VFINTIEPRKNLVGLIEAFELVPGSTELVIGGKLGWKYKESMRRMRQSKKSKFIKYLGYVPEADKAAIMKLAKVLAYPSFYEGFGFQPLEAMALGVPVVCTQVTSLPEAVGDAAIMVDPRSTTDIARALTAATMDESLRRHLISKGYEQAAEFSWDAAAQGMLEVFNTLYT